MKKPLGKLVTVSSLAAFLLSSFLVAGGLDRVEAQESDSSGVSAASGSNRFVIWQDGTPGNFDIFFRRSTDNGATWQPLVNLSNNPGNSLNPQIVVSGSNVYVIWTQYSSDGTLADVFFRGSTNNGATWGAKIKISSSGTNFSPFTPRVAATGSNVYITWQDDGPFDVFLRRSTDNGATWKSIVNISNNSGDSSEPEVAVSGSSVYVVWYDNTPGNYEVLLKRSTNGGATWGSFTNLSNNAGSSFSPQIAAIGSNIHIVWIDQTPGNSDIFFRRSTDNGSSWKSTINLSSNAKTSSGPQISVSGSSVYVVWQQRISADLTKAYFKGSTNNGGTWGPKTEISTNSSSLSSPPDVTAFGSNVYISWSDEGTSDIFFRRSTDNGATWKPMVNISSNAGNSRDAQIAVSGSIAYIVWSDQTPGTYDIMFKRSTNSGATWNSVKNLSSNSANSELPQLGV